jgi:hypothetical protein
MTTLSPVDIANLALARCGAQRIASLTDQANTSAILVNGQFQLAYLEISRANRWGCLMAATQLVEIVQTPLAGVVTTPVSTVAWAPLTTYAALTYVTFAGTIYQISFPYTSTNNFYTDLLTGALTQQDFTTNSPAFGSISAGSNYASGWGHQYALPSDFVLLSTLNDNNCWEAQGQGSEWEIMGTSLFTNDAFAIVKYVKNVTDTTLFDPMFCSALVALLASKLVTALRLDSGSLSETFMAEYQRLVSAARAKDGDQMKVRRFNPINTSTFIGSRYGGING